MKRLTGVVLVLLVVLTIRSPAATPLPPKPEHYYNDYAGLTSQQTQRELDAKLTDFERQTSNQILVAIFQELPADVEIADYTQRVAESWGVGQRKTENGVVLFVFAKSRKMYIQVGYGLEGALPDLLAKQIIQNEIAPAFRESRYDEGLTRGVTAILAATRGKYKGTGSTQGSRDDNSGQGSWPLLLFIVLFVLFQWYRSRSRPARGSMYDRGGRRYVRDPWGASIFPPFGGGGSSGSGNGGGGFSGGGGRFGGGGAGGDW